MVLNMEKVADVDVVKLERKDVEVSEILPNGLTLSMENMQEVPAHLLFRLQGWMWAQRPERRIIGTAWTRVPKTWWDHLKETIAVKWPLFRPYLNWEWKEIHRDIEVDLQVAYPELRLLMPNYGKHLVIAQIVPGKEDKDGQYYWRWEHDEVGSDAK